MPRRIATLLRLLPKRRRKRRKRRETLLETKFRVEREHVFDNYFMNEDTIALSVGEYGDLFVDTGTNPLQVRQAKEIDPKKNLWLKPTFWSDGPGEKLKRYSGPIGFRTWPAGNTVRRTDKMSRQGSHLTVERDKTYKYWNDLYFERIADDTEVIILRDADNPIDGYYRLVGRHRELRASANRA